MYMYRMMVTSFTIHAIILYGGITRVKSKDRISTGRRHTKSAISFTLVKSITILRLHTP